MPAPFAFPGHYWDEEKGKFFKIEATATAPAGAQWSRQEVDAHDRRQQIVDQERQWNRRRRQRQRPSKDDEGVQHGQRPLSKRAKTVYLPYAAASSSSGVGTMRSGDTRLSYGGDDDELDEEPEPVTSRLFDRYLLLAHEVGGEAAVGINRMPGRSRGGTTAVLYARDLEYKGAVPVLDESHGLSAERFPPGIACMYVHTEELKPGLGIVYTNYFHDHDHQGIKGQYIPVDDSENIIDFVQSPRLAPYQQYQRTRPEELFAWNTTAICFHEGTRMLIVGSSVQQTDSSQYTPVLQLFSPQVADDTTRGEGITWQFGYNDARLWEATDRPAPKKPVYSILGRHRDSVTACVASPQGYDAMCLVGTEADLYAVDLMTTTTLATRDMNSGGSCWNMDTEAWQNPGGVNLRMGYGNGTWDGMAHHPYVLKRQRLLSPALSKKVEERTPRRGNLGMLSVDFLNKHPRLAVAGCHDPAPWLIDLRENSWHAFGSSDMLGGRRAQSLRMESSGSGESNVVAHVRSAGEHRVVAASVRNLMLMYDLRYIKSTRSKRGEDVVAGALFRFQNYRNSARARGLGFAVDAELGIAAVAEEHEYYTGLGGGLSLYSLATGERLDAPGLWPVSHSAERLARIYQPTEHLLHVPRTTTTTATTSKPAVLSSMSKQPYITVNRPSDRKDKHSRFAHRFAKMPLPRVPALSFAALPRESTSLFVAVDAQVHKFSMSWGREDVLFSEDEEDKREGREEREERADGNMDSVF